MWVYKLVFAKKDLKWTFWINPLHGSSWKLFLKARHFLRAPWGVMAMIDTSTASRGLITLSASRSCSIYLAASDQYPLPPEALLGGGRGVLLCPLPSAHRPQPSENILTNLISGKSSDFLPLFFIFMSDYCVIFSCAHGYCIHLTL